MRHLVRRRARSRQRAHGRGVTLVELMIAIAILGLLIAIGLPHFGEFHANSRLREAGHVLQAEALFAQSEAVRRNQVVRLSTSGSTVLVQEAANPASMTTLHTRPLPDGVQVATATVDYAPRGFPIDRSVSPTVEFVAYTIDLSLASGTCSSDVRCPRLLIEAGGGARLCADKLATCP